MSATLIYNGRPAKGAVGTCWILIEDKLISAAGTGTPPDVDGAVKIDARGALMLPGMIDTHVHFREPGLTRKGTIRSESRAALLGGITSYLEMPNTIPPTTTIAALEEKRATAARDSAANYGFFLGASENNITEIRSLNPREVPGVKLFIGSSTGNMAVNSDEALEAIFEATSVPVMVHAEDDAVIAANAEAAIEKYGSTDRVPVEEHSAIRSGEACVSASRRAIALAMAHGKRLHIAHLSTAAELELAGGCGGLVTTEVTPLHLSFDTSDYASKGTRIKVNPAVKSPADREALTAAIREGRIGTIGSDHAPHLPAEKSGGALKAASGAPSVQFALPVLLGMLPPELVEEKYSSAPARLFDIAGRGSLSPGNFADVVLVEECAPYTLTDEDSASPCGWTPFVGMTLRHRVRDVWVNGTQAVKDGHLTGSNAAMALEFDR